EIGPAERDLDVAPPGLGVALPRRADVVPGAGAGDEERGRAELGERPRHERLDLVGARHVRRHGERARQRRRDGLHLGARARGDRHGRSAGAERLGDGPADAAAAARDDRDLPVEIRHAPAYTKTLEPMRLTLPAGAYSEQMTERLGLDGESLVVELASNDGYLLQHFVARGIPALGIDPAANVAEAALARGVETLVEFFDTRLASELAESGRRADLIAANNVLAQVPALRDFVEGVRILLAPAGVATIEVPHLVRLVEGLQFDTIYHEHYSYFSFHTLVELFARHDLQVFDVEELPSHGGSLRVFVRRPQGAAEPAVEAMLEAERDRGYDRLEGYAGFGARVAETKWRLLELLIGLRGEGARVVGYGAPGKGNTLLNYCGIRTDLLDYTVDRNPLKHG